MQTHDSSDFRSEWLNSLVEKANRMTSNKQSTITAGNQDEQSICEWHATNKVYCRRLPDDEHGILRISVGGGDSTPVQLNYCTLRGGVGQCIELLEKAIAALRECPDCGGVHRGHCWCDYRGDGPQVRQLPRSVAPPSERELKEFFKRMEVENALSDTSAQRGHQDRTLTDRDSGSARG